MCINNQRERGISLIELIMFIMIVSVALAGILLVMNVTTLHSSDPLVHKQALAIAESLLEEIELMPFTYCDPDDANAANATAATAAQCPKAGGVGGVEALGPETDANGTETRYGSLTAAPNFDNVNDYAGAFAGAPGFHMTVAGGIQDITNNTVLTGYDALVTMTTPNLVAPSGTVAGTDGNGAPQVLLINVTVTGPDNVPITLEGYRTRYSPKA
jgi:MSHA pilin protein MshD